MAPTFVLLLLLEPPVVVNPLSVKNFQATGLVPKYAAVRLSLGQTPLFAQGLEVQQPQKVGCVPLQA